MKRPLLILAVLLTIALGAFAWRVWPRSRTFYTDADTIREPRATAVPRDILWQPPTLLPAEINSDDDDYEPRVAADGQTLYFVRGKAGGAADIYSCRRTLSGWQPPQPLAEINSAHDDLGPQPSADGQTLYFYSDRPGGLGGYDLWVAQRSDDGFLPPINLGPLVNSEFNDYGPAPTPDGKALYFASNRPQPGDAKRVSTDAWPATLREDIFRRDYDLFIAPITDGGVGQPTSLAALNTPSNEGSPAVNPFGDFLYFASDRPGGQGGYDLYRARRLRGEHRPPTHLGVVVNTAANELDPALDLGGYALLFSSDRTVASREVGAAREYNLFQSTSREVFTETEHESRPIDWAAVWRRFGPNLLWALLALLLSLLLLRYLRNAKFRKLSLLMRCLLASLLLHLLLMLLFNFWQVTAGVAGLLRHGGAVQVALVPRVGTDGLASQLRGAITTLDTPAAAELVVLERPAATVEFSHELRIEALPVEHTVASPDRPLPQPLRGESARRPISPATPTFELVRLEPAASPNLPLPAQPAALSVSETVLTTDVALAESSVSARVRPLVEAAVSSAAPAPAELAPAPVGVDSEADRAASLADAASTRDAKPGTSIPRAVSEVFSVTDPAAPSAVALPQAEGEARIAAAEPRIKPVLADAASPIRSASMPLPQHAPALRPVEMAPTAVATPSSEASIASTATDPARDASPPTTPAPIGAPALPAPVTALALALPSAPPPSQKSRASQPSEARPTLAAAPLPTLRAAPPTAPDRVTRPAATPLAVVPPSAAATQREQDTSLASVAGSTRGADRMLPPSPAAIPTAASPVPSDARALNLRVPTEEQPPADRFVQRDPEQRVPLLKRMGGSDETEAAVGRALQWLAAHQSPDGRWDGNSFDERCGRCGGAGNVDADAAITGLTLLCFLGADHTHAKDGPYRENVQRALRWLVERQRPSGDLRGDETMYSHGIATIALSEAYGMTRDADLAAPVRRAVNFIVEARNTDVGGWRYDPGDPGDTSVLGWQIMALKSAQMAGIEVPDVAFDTARQWLDRVSRPTARGRYCYQPGRKPTPAMTAEAMFVQQLLGLHRDDPRMAQSAELLLQNLPAWSAKTNTYYWYYATLALFQHQGDEWHTWNAALTQQLLAHQQAAGRAAGSWPPVGSWTNEGGRIYQTALCTLMLEVYYRYLPLYSLGGS